MKNLNQCMFIGNITRDPECKVMPNGTAVTNFSIACNDDYKKDGQDFAQCNYINLVAFGKTGEIIGQYCTKGSKIFVSGKQRTRKWQHSDGTDRYSTEIVVDSFEFLDSKPKGQSEEYSESNPTYNKPQANQSDGDPNDEIPF